MDLDISPVMGSAKNLVEAIKLILFGGLQLSD